MNLELPRPAAGTNRESMLDQLSDAGLLQRMAGGDEEAFATLYRRRQGGLFRFALQMSGSAAIAEEVVQETFLTLIQQPELYDPKRGAVSSLLYGVARNFVLRHLERDRRFVTFEEEEWDEAGGSAVDLEGLEQLDKLRRALGSLPPKYREVVALCELEEMSYAEAAAVIGCRIGSVRSRLHRARELLLRKLRNGDADGSRQPAPAAKAVRNLA
jgi:RNA polymerase sigma-70 factor (ECF subfamily)